MRSSSGLDKKRSNAEGEAAGFLTFLRPPGGWPRWIIGICVGVVSGYALGWIEGGTAPSPPAPAPATPRAAAVVEPGSAALTLVPKEIGRLERHVNAESYELVRIRRDLERAIRR